VLNIEENINQQPHNETINTMHKDTTIYVENLLDVRSKNHGTNGPPQLPL
jgi:hypothetical protein